MAGNPLISLGTLNRVRGSFTFAQNQALNVTAPYLGKNAISARPTTNAGLYIPTLTGAVTSPEPYQIYDITIHLVKTTPLASAFKAQIESLVNLGPATYIPDASQLPNWQFDNVMLISAGDMNTAGTEADLIITLMGTYYTNSQIFNLT